MRELRLADSKATLDRIIETLKQKPGRLPKKWQDTTKTYHAKMRSGDLVEVATAVRDLHPRTNEISYSQRRLYEGARRLLVEAVALILGIDERGATKSLEEQTSLYLSDIHTDSPVMQVRGNTPDPFDPNRHQEQGRQVPPPSAMETEMARRRERQGETSQAFVPSEVLLPLQSPPLAVKTSRVPVPTPAKTRRTAKSRQPVAVDLVPAPGVSSPPVKELVKPARYQKKEKPEVTPSVSMAESSIVSSVEVSQLQAQLATLKAALVAEQAQRSKVERQLQQLQTAQQELGHALQEARTKQRTAVEEWRKAEEARRITERNNAQLRQRVARLEAKCAEAVPVSEVEISDELARFRRATSGLRSGNTRLKRHVLSLKEQVKVLERNAEDTAMRQQALLKQIQVRIAAVRDELLSRINQKEALFDYLIEKRKEAEIALAATEEKLADATARHRP